MSTRRLDTRCPYCGTVNDAVSGEADARPEPGDCSICFSCAGVSVFTDDGVRRPTVDELTEMMGDADVRRLIGAINVGQQAAGLRPRLPKGTQRLPCGCVMGSVQTAFGSAFVMQPCSLLCEYYLYTVAEAKRQGKPVQTMVLEDKP